MSRSTTYFHANVYHYFLKARYVYLRYGRHLPNPTGEFSSEPDLGNRHMRNSDLRRKDHNLALRTFRNNYNDYQMRTKPGNRPLTWARLEAVFYKTIDDEVPPTMDKILNRTPRSIRFPSSQKRRKRMVSRSTQVNKKQKFSK